MDLSKYLETTTQEALANSIKADDGRGVTQGAISQWLRKRVPAERVLQLVRVSGGAMNCHALRPDLYPRDDDAHSDRDRLTADAPLDAGMPIVATSAAAEPSTVDGEAA